MITTQPQTFTLTPDQITYLQACHDDSYSEGHFDAAFKDIDVPKVERELVVMGLLDIPIYED